MTSVDNTTRTLDDALQAAAKACADACLIRASDTRALSDYIATDNAGAAKMLRGSVLKFIPPGGAASFRIVPTVGEVLTTGATPKLLVIDKIGNIAKGATVANLAADGLVDLLPGVLTSGGEAGSRAGEVTAGGLAAELNPPSAAGLITKLSVKIAGTAVEVDVEDAAKMLSLSSACAVALPSVSATLGPAAGGASG